MFLVLAEPGGLGPGPGLGAALLGLVLRVLCPALLGGDQQDVPVPDTDLPHTSGSVPLD